MPITAADIQHGTGFALNPATGKYEQAYAKYGQQPVEWRNVPDEQGNMQSVPIYDDSAQADHYDYSFDPTGRQSLAGWAPGYYTDNGGGLFGGALGAILQAAAGTAGFGVGGVSGASAATGNGVTPQTIAADAAGLGAGAGLAAALPATGLSTTATSGLSGLGGVEGLGGVGSTGADALAGTEVLGGVEGVGAGGGLAAAGGSGSAVVPPLTAPVVAATTGVGATKLSDILSGKKGIGDLTSEATVGDLSRLLGAALPAGLGYLGASKQTDAYNDLANKYMGLGAPYRDLLSQYTTDPNKFINSPGVQSSVNQGTSALARALSVNGNPAGSGHALQELQNYATNSLWGQYGAERDRLAGYGGLTNYAAAAPGAASGAINAEASGYNALGYGLGSYLNPKPTLTDFAKAMKGLT